MKHSQINASDLPTAEVIDSEPAISEWTRRVIITVGLTGFFLFAGIGAALVLS